MLRYVEIYNYCGEWIMLIVNPDTYDVEWCACNYRTFDDLCDDLEEIRCMITLDELRTFKPTLKQDTDILSHNKELMRNANVVRRALWHKHNKYLHEISEIFFEDESHERDIQIIVYNNNAVNYSIIVLNCDNVPIWMHEGYRYFGKVMFDVRRIQHMADIGHDISKLDGCGIECANRLYPVNCFFNEYYECMKYNVRLGQLVKVHFK